MAKWRVHFRIDMSTYRDVEADGRDEAWDQVNGDMYEMTDYENAAMGSICVEDVEEMKPQKPTNRKKARK